MKDITKPGVSSPASTGGSGNIFERHVAAYWLAQLLVRSIPPILVESSVVEVSFQTERLGWNTDDFLVICEQAGAERKLAGQVKRSLTISASNDECASAVKDFWLDFNRGNQFDPTSDRLVLVMLRGTNVVLEHFVGLLDSARASANTAEFEARLQTPRLLHKTVLTYFSEIQTIISNIEGKPVSSADLWPFFRVLHVLSLDLGTSTAQTESSIVSLLGCSVNEGDRVAVARSSWTALLEVADKAIPEAQTLRRERLPQALLDRHSSLGHHGRDVLAALRSHSDLVFLGINPKLGPDLHLPRIQQTQDALDALEFCQVVILTGPAGSGKSVITRNATSFLGRDHFVFGFRAEEFAKPHLDATLHDAQIPTNGATLAAILASQDRKVIAIESIERLLERSTRDGFSDLMNLVRQDASFRVLLTCRDYSTDQVRSSFLPLGISHTVIGISLLSDLELGDVEKTYPKMAGPLSNAALRQILRNPYFLDKALRLDWSPTELPQTERAFRQLFWAQVVRAESKVSPTIARQREHTFQEIAVRRARALSPYVPSTELSHEIVEALRQDSILASPDGNGFLVATAHDVLEDWAILHWIEEQNLVAAGEVTSLAEIIGPHPAIRRSYRKWLAELAERDAVAADRLFESAITASLPAHFRDDTIVALLQAPSSPEFLLRHEKQFLANGNALLKQVIHLLRVACMKEPEGKESIGMEWTFNIPSGPAWSPVLQLVCQGLSSFSENDHAMVVGLAEDAVRTLGWRAPDIQIQEYVSVIAHWLEGRCDDYRSEKLHKRILELIAKVPKGDPVKFEALLRGSNETKDGRRRTADELQDIVFSEHDGGAMARDLPALAVSVGTTYILANETELKSGSYHSVSFGVEAFFGVKVQRSHGYFPASALHGPWLTLLRYHPLIALDFYAHVFNHCASRYGNPLFEDRLEPAWATEITFPDGSKKVQWTNPRLWSLYRGTSVGPSLLQSMLMALEKRLLEYALAHPETLDRVLLRILNQADSAMIASVVGSIATAYPHQSSDTLLALLSSTDYLRLDLHRRVAESTAIAISLMGSPLGNHEHHDQERLQANELAHRAKHLEDAARDLQLGPHASKVHALIDRHKAVLATMGDQSEETKTLRLALHRMDLRQYKATLIENAPQEPSISDEPTPTPRMLVHLEPVDPEPDVKEMVDRTTARYEKLGPRLSLVNWAYAIFNRRASSPPDPSLWASFLDKAMASSVTQEYDGDLETELCAGGPSILAAVCVRDHWQEMSLDQQHWCVERVCVEVLASANQWGQTHRMQRHDMAPDRACAWSLALLMHTEKPETDRSVVQNAFAAAITHPTEEVRWHTVCGVANNMSLFQTEFISLCVNALALEAVFIQDEHRANEGVPWPEKQKLQQGESARAAAFVRGRFWTTDGIPSDAYRKLDPNDWIGTEASTFILTILAADPSHPLATQVFIRASQLLVKGWNDHRTSRGSGQRNYQAETALADQIERFAMGASFESAKAVLDPIIKAVDKHPREVHSIIQGLTKLEDGMEGESQYWRLWGLFADAVKSASWLGGLEDEHPWGSEVICTIFLTKHWKKNIRHWRRLEGNAQNVDELFETLLPSWYVLDSYVRFLYHIGEQSLPSSFARIATKLKDGEPRALLSDHNTVFLLEVLLQRHVYGRPLELKRELILRDSVLYLLDTLVEVGSAAAYRMRDDFVTPMSS